jgi:Zn-dependent protease with chaperone function
MSFVNMAMAAVCVQVFGWGWLTQQVLIVEWEGKALLAPFAELAVPLPFFAVLIGSWIVYYDSELALYRMGMRGPRGMEFWSRFAYFANHCRQFGLMVMLPVLLFVVQVTVERYLPESTRSDWYRLGTMAAVPLLILLMPLLMKPLLGFRSLPDGPERTRLEAVAKRLHFRCADFLLWPTRGVVANAMIMGLIPRFRYVVFTDRILEDLPPDELDAVFGHEVGHAKHGHIWFYGAFLALSVATLAAASMVIEQRLNEVGVDIPSWAEDWISFVPFAITGSYLFLVFGYLSRRCERQADVYGCRAVSCGDPNCLGHGSETVYLDGANGVCPTGVRTFIGALERVHLVNGNVESLVHRPTTLQGAIESFFEWVKAWLHSTSSRRIAFLRSLIGNRERERAFQRQALALQWGLLLGLAAALYGCGEALGWRNLWEKM